MLIICWKYWLNNAILLYTDNASPNLFYPKTIPWVKHWLSFFFTLITVISYYLFLVVVQHSVVVVNVIIIGREPFKEQYFRFEFHVNSIVNYFINTF